MKENLFLSWQANTLNYCVAQLESAENARTLQAHRVNSMATIESNPPCHAIIAVFGSSSSLDLLKVPPSSFTIFFFLTIIYDSRPDRARCSPHGMLGNSIVKTIESAGMESSVRRCRNLLEGERHTSSEPTAALMRRDPRGKLLDRITSAAGSASVDACSSRNSKKKIRRCRSTLEKMSF